ncbi:MAG: M16 family metallopeptidase, partial [Candidatus Binatia bacterium]
KHLPMVVMTALVDGGGRYDPIGKEGVASLTAALLTEGTKGRKSEAIHDAIDFLGAQLSAGAADDYASVTLTVLKKDLDAAADLWAAVTREPTFPKEEFERKRDETLAELEDEDQNPGAVAGRAFRRALYRNGAYRTPVSGDKESIRKLQLADVKSHYESVYRPERTIIVASGDVTLAEIRALVEKRLGDWKGKGEAAKSIESAPATEPQVVRIERDLQQANVVWGHAGTTRDDPEWYALSVMSYILGAGGFESRLMRSIRTDAGLAYSVHSYFTGPKLPGALQVVLQTKNSTAKEAIERLEQEIQRIREEPVSDEELEGAKLFLTGSFPLRFDSNAELVAFYSQVRFFNLGLDYPARYPGIIEAITKEDVQRVARKYLHPDKAILIVVGRQSEIELPK